MAVKSGTRTILGAATWIMLVIALSSLNAQSQTPGAKTMPLRAADFKPAALRGFGDRNNSWPQAMVWWQGNLYVGTTRQMVCTSLFALYQYVAGIFDRTFADTWLPYPPPDPDLSCAPDGGDLS